MKVAIAREMRELDRRAMDEYHYPGLLLMEHAALAVFQRIQERFRPEKAAIICGKGNNAGDGWALARLLKLSGVAVMVFSPEVGVELPPDAETNRRMARRLGLALGASDSCSGAVAESISTAFTCAAAASSDVSSTCSTDRESRSALGSSVVLSGRFPKAISFISIPKVVGTLMIPFTALRANDGEKAAFSRTLHCPRADGLPCVYSAARVQMACRVSTALPACR